MKDIDVMMAIFQKGKGSIRREERDGKTLVFLNRKTTVQFDTEGNYIQTIPTEKWEDEG